LLHISFESGENIKIHIIGNLKFDKLVIKSVKDVVLLDFVNSVIVVHVDLFNHSKVGSFEQELQILQFCLLFSLIFIKLKLLDMRYIASAQFLYAWCPVLVHSQYF
jgi:hypothetical protein